jgi:hypothetical protein
MASHELPGIAMPVITTKYGNRLSNCTDFASAPTGCINLSTIRRRCRNRDRRRKRWQLGNIDIDNDHDGLGFWIPSFHLPPLHPLLQFSLEMDEKPDGLGP